jgi:protein tyrosine/serine phosphatase
VTANWIDLDTLVNLRDVGGIATTDGRRIASGALLRSDNLQSLTASDIRALLDLGLTDVIDLRSDLEVSQEGPGPLTQVDAVTIHHHSLFQENLTEAETEAELTEQLNGDQHAAEQIATPAPTSAEVAAAQALPWVELVKPTIEVENDSTSFYLSYIADRPDSVVASLRAIAYAEGAALVHCAAGKDRTGTIVALALRLVGADRQAVIDDYAATSERIERIIDKLASSNTYRDNVLSRPVSSHNTYPETMQLFLDYIDTEHGSVDQLMARLGWTEDDTAALRAKLLAAD